MSRDTISNVSYNAYGIVLQGDLKPRAAIVGIVDIVRVVGRYSIMTIGRWIYCARIAVVLLIRINLTAW